MPRLPLIVIIMTGAVLMAALVLLSVAYGSTVIPLKVVVKAIEHTVLPVEDAIRTPLERIVVDLRLPRALLAICIGAGLGIVGALLQTVSRNDLADPFLFGLSSGAAAGAVSVITIHGDRLGIWTLPIAAFTGGMLASVIVLMLIKRMGNQGPERLILAGLAVSFVFTAITNYLVFAGDQRAAHSVLFWSLGGLGLAQWQNLPLAAIGLIAIFSYAMRRHRKLDALLAGENTALSLGINPERMRRGVFIIAAFSTAIFVSVSGIIGFIGLMVPHIARWLNGPLHLGIITLSGIIGAILLLGSDLTARIILAPQELPIGIVTTSIGAVFVFAMLLNRR